MRQPEDGAVREQSWTARRLGAVAHAGGEQYWVRLQLAVMDNDVLRARRIVEELFAAVHGAPPAIDPSDPFSSICDDVRLCVTLEGQGYDTIQSIALATDAELMRIPRLNAKSLDAIDAVLIAYGFRAATHLQRLQSAVENPGKRIKKRPGRFQPRRPIAMEIA